MHIVQLLQSPLLAESYLEMKNENQSTAIPLHTCAYVCIFMAYKQIIMNNIRTYVIFMLFFKIHGKSCSHITYIQYRVQSKKTIWQ